MVTPLVTMSGGASTSLGNSRQPGSEVIQGCARGSNWSQNRRSGPRKRAAFDGAVSGDGPGTSSLGGESNPVNPSAGSATEGVRGRFTTFAPGRQRRGEGALFGGLEITCPQGRTGWVPWETGDDRAIHAEAGSSSSNEAPLDHAVAKVSTGRTVWKLSSMAKADGGGDSRAERSVECSCCKSVADVG